MKKKKSKNKLHIKIMPLPLNHLNLSNINKTPSISPIKNNNKINSDISYNNKYKSKTIKVNKNAYNYNKFNKTPQRLNTMNIIDKKIDIIYDWNILLNNKNPGIYYNKSSYKKLLINNFETEKDCIPKNSLILLDLPESQVKKYFTKKSFIKYNKHPQTAKVRKFPSNIFNKNNTDLTKSPREEQTPRNYNSILNEYDSNIIHNNVHPISFSSPRDPHQPFYFSKDFNDYYKSDIKQFVKRIPSLQAKIKTSNKKLMKEIINLKYNAIKDSNNLRDFFENDEKVFKVQDLIIAGIRNNPARLMKNLYMLKNPNYKKVKQDMKMYFKTMKPIGEQYDEIDYTKNERWRTLFEIRKLRKEEKKYNTLDNYNKNKDDKYKSNLTLSYYKATDPHIKYFNKLMRKYKKNINENDNNELYIKGFNYKKKKKKKMIEINDEKNWEFFRDKLVKNNNKKDENVQIGNGTQQYYQNYFLTETTKNSNNND